MIGPTRAITHGTIFGFQLSPINFLILLDKARIINHFIKKVLLCFQKGMTHWGNGEERTESWGKKGGKEWCVNFTRAQSISYFVYQTILHY